MSPAGRAGTGLVEILVATALVAGPLVGALHLVQGSAIGARHGRDRATARQVLLDLATLLRDRNLDELEDALLPGNEWKLKELMDMRIAIMDVQVRESYRGQVRGMLRTVCGRLEQNLDPEAPGLVRLTLCAWPGNGPAVRVRLLFRPGPGARPDPARSAGVSVPRSEG